MGLNVFLFLFVHIRVFMNVCYVLYATKGQLISKCLFGASILPKNERKQFDLSYHSSKVEFLLVFWENWRYQKDFSKLTDMTFNAFWNVSWINGFTQLGTMDSFIKDLSPLCGRELQFCQFESFCDFNLAARMGSLHITTIGIANFTGRLLVDIKGEFSWTKWVNSRGHFFNSNEKSYTIINQ